MPSDLVRCLNDATGIGGARIRPSGRFPVVIAVAICSSVQLPRAVSLSGVRLGPQKTPRLGTSKLTSEPRDTEIPRYRDTEIPSHIRFPEKASWRMAIGAWDVLTTYSELVFRWHWPCRKKRRAPHSLARTKALLSYRCEYR
jgi:hypothetical protein